ncbi:MAG TPA: terminase TerL endonuclease subunit [Alloacidobacterium sp.]|jgi:phage terminase large subunit-like protein|nr:terminase TerL endonuclease subunit [Alloacidobacterium sp.]
MKKAKKSASQISYAERAESYARDVVDGTTIACKWVRLACKRHLDDLRLSRLDTYRWRFDAAKANRFCRFFEGLPHVKDDFRGNAARGQLFKLEGWQIFGLCSIFGWVDKKHGYRRFTEAYWEVPRKNGKTPIAAGIGLYMLCADGEYGAEIFAGATSKEQAGEVFGAARNMALASSQLREAFGIWCNAASIVIPTKNSAFKPLKGNPGDGPSPSCVLVDEYHEHKTNSLVDWARTGMQARRQPLLFEITTAGSDMSSPCFDKHLEVQEVLEGHRENDRLFGIIFTVDEGIGWTTKKAVQMANPNLGVSVNPEQIFHDQKQAAQSARQQNQFKTKNLNIWVNADVAWMNMEKWNQCAAPLRIEDFAGDMCIESCDLASRIDTVSSVRLFKREQDDGDHYYCFSRHYLNQVAVEDEKNTHFRAWRDRGYLIQTPGDVTHYSRVIEDLAADSRTLNLREIVFDPFHAAGLIQFLREREDWNQSVECVEIKQTIENMSAPMKELEAIVLSGRFHFDGNPVLSWMISNTVCHRDRKENIFPVRNRVQNKIDGTVALIMALSRAMVLSPATAGTIEVW